jgi:hypothetical protein
LLLFIYFLVCIFNLRRTGSKFFLIFLLIEKKDAVNQKSQKGIFQNPPESL